MKASDLSVLIVEDDPESVDIANTTLKGTGVNKIDVAVNEQQAAEYSGKNNYDLVICDTMCNGNYPFGPKVIKAIMRMGKNPKVVALSSDSEYKEYWKDYKDVKFFEKIGFLMTLLPAFLKEEFGI